MESEREARSVQAVYCKGGMTLQESAVENRKESEDLLPDTQGSVAKGSQVENALWHWQLTQSDRVREKSWVPPRSVVSPRNTGGFEKVLEAGVD